MKYNQNKPYLVASIVYLATNGYWWARSAEELASELSLDEHKLRSVFENFPELFRKSRDQGEDGRHFYALQMRYSQRKGGKTSEPRRVSHIPPLSAEQLRMLLDYVLHAAEAEARGDSAQKTNFITLMASSVAALAAITAAVLSAG